jgi:GNAT superfamily N-acetyltransferase
MIEIRPVRQEDFPAWQVLWDGYNAFYGRAGDTRLATEIIRMTWSRFFDSYEPVHALVAERAGTLLGLAHFIFHRSTIHIGPLCYLQDLFTAQAARGQRTRARGGCQPCLLDDARDQRAGHEAVR